jgi:hypothetical protein
MMSKALFELPGLFHLNGAPATLDHCDLDLLGNNECISGSGNDNGCKGGSGNGNGCGGGSAP